MSQLKQQLQADLKDAMLKKDNFKRDVIRFLMSALKQIEVDERKELSDEDITKIIINTLIAICAILVFITFLHLPQLFYI